MWEIIYHFFYKSPFVSKETIFEIFHMKQCSLTKYSWVNPDLRRNQAILMPRFVNSLTYWGKKGFDSLQNWASGFVTLLRLIDFLSFKWQFKLLNSGYMRDLWSLKVRPFLLSRFLEKIRQHLPCFVTLLYAPTSHVITITIYGMILYTTHITHIVVQRCKGLKTRKWGIAQRIGSNFSIEMLLAHEFLDSNQGTNYF